MEQLITALYCRVSREDDLAELSSSIETQKTYLKKYAIENNLTHIRFYIDDGYSGTSFERPGFQELIQDIEEHNVTTVITKDLSRLGRNYLTTGYYIEHYFPTNSVRYIAINDNVDTSLSENEFTPFRNILNEWYAKDISKKIRSAYRTKAIAGQFTGSYAPYGYTKDPKNKNHLIVHEQQAQVVREIFKLYLDGFSIYRIAHRLKEKNVLTPRAETNLVTGKYGSSEIVDYPFVWSVGTISSILENREYTGCTVSNKHQTKSYKNKKLSINPKSDWIIVKGMHQAIIDESSFELVQQIKSKNKRVKKYFRTNIFRGHIYCGDCGKSLSLSVRPDRQTHGTFECSSYKRYSKIKCISHYITYEVVQNYVITNLVYLIKSYKKDKNKFIANLMEINNISESTKKLTTKRIEITNRLNKVNEVIKNLYESFVFKHISDDVFHLLEKTYEQERSEIMIEIEQIQNRLDQCQSFVSEASKFCDILSTVKYPKQLNEEIIDTLINRIFIYNTKSNGVHRDIEIQYKFIGKI